MSRPEDSGGRFGQGAGRLYAKSSRTNGAEPAGPALVRPLDGEAVDLHNVMFEWLPVTDPHGSESVGYAVIVGCEEPGLVDYAGQAGRDVTSVTVSSEILGQGGGSASGRLWRSRRSVTR